MKPSRGYINDPIAMCDLVIGIKNNKIVVIKNRNGEKEESISLSQMLSLIGDTLYKRKLSKALEPIIEKLSILETFEND